MCLLNRARVKDYLHDSENWPRSPFNRYALGVISTKNKCHNFANARTRINQFDTIVFFVSSVPHLKVWKTF